MRVCVREGERERGIAQPVQYEAFGVVWCGVQGPGWVGFSEWSSCQMRRRTRDGTSGRWRCATAAAAWALAIIGVGISAASASGIGRRHWHWHSSRRSQSLTSHHP